MIANIFFNNNNNIFHHHIITKNKTNISKYYILHNMIKPLKKAKIVLGVGEFKTRKN